MKPDAAPAPDAVAADGQPVPVSKTVSKRQQQINDRIREGVEAELARRAVPPPAFQYQPVPPPPAAAPTLRDRERYMALPNAPKLEQFENYEQFVAELAIFINDTRDEERQTRAQRTQHEQHEQRAHEQAATSFRTRTDAARQKYPDYDAKVAPLAARMVPNQGDPIADRVFRSPVSSDLLYLFVSDPQVIPALIASVQGLTDQQAREEISAQIGRLEARFDASAAPAPLARSPQTTTSAPEPPHILGSRASEPVDPIAGALRSRDTGRYIALANARDLAAAKSR